MNNVIKRLENLFMAVSFAEANSMKLFTLSVNEALAEDAFVHKRSREVQTDKSKKSVEIFGKAEMQKSHF